MSVEEKTRTSNPAYDLVSVMYHALQGAETAQRYVADAEQHGDRELADFVREVQQKNAETAERAKGLLRSRLDR